MTKKQKRVLLGIALIIALMAVSMMFRAETISYTAQIVEAEEPKPTLSHAQEVWKNALEWCESNGNQKAINPNDLDGTASWGGYQFKPSTLDYFAGKYGIATTTVMDYEVQNAVVTQMILHRNDINWHQQFPWCVKKLGIPPK